MVSRSVVIHEGRNRHRCKKPFFTFFIIFIKNAFLTFLFFERFLFSSDQDFNSTKPAKLLYRLK